MILTNKDKIFLSYDPGLNDAGVSIISYSSGVPSGFSLLFSKHYKSNAKKTQELRMWEQFELMDSLFSEYNIDFISTEKQFSGFMSGLDSIPRLLSGKYNVPISFLVPRTWVKKLTGFGNSSKEQIKNKVLSFIDKTDLSEHEYDAIGMSLAQALETEPKPKKKKKKNVHRTKKNTEK